MILVTFTTLLIIMASHSACCARQLVNAAVGRKVTLPCQTDLPYPVDWRYTEHDTASGEYIFIGGNRGMYWQHHNRTELTVTNVIGTNVTIYNLTIYNLNMKDTGIYTCIEDEGLGTKHPFLLNVSCTPTTINATVGRRVTLPCQTDHTDKVDWKYKQLGTAKEEEEYIFSDGSPAVSWQHHSRTKLTVVNVADTNVTIYNLTISSLVVSDTGIYTCIEEAGIGTKHRFWLQVNARRPEPDTKATVGNTVVLPCNITKPADWKYKLYDGDEEIYIFINGSKGVCWQHYDRTELQLTRDAGDYNLVLKNVNVGDTGVYTCVEETGSRDSKSLWLQVYESYSRQVIEVTVGNNATLPCRSRPHYPDWKYKENDEAMEYTYIFIAGKPENEWKHYDRTELTSVSLIIRSVTISDTGEYTCIEDEGLGNVHPFWLRVSEPIVEPERHSTGFWVAVSGLLAALLVVAVFITRGFCLRQNKKKQLSGRESVQMKSSYSSNSLREFQDQLSTLRKIMVKYQKTLRSTLSTEPNTSDVAMQLKALIINQIDKVQNNEIMRQTQSGDSADKSEESS